MIEVVAVLLATGQSLIRALKMLRLKGKGVQRAVDQAGRSVGECFIISGWVPCARASVVRPETPSEPRCQH